MKRISAHWIYPVSSPPLKYGILEIEDDGTIIRVIDTGGKVREVEKLLFYPGILVPGFVNAHCHLELSHLADIIPGGAGMPDFVKGMMNQKPCGDAVIFAAMQRADQRMYNNGIVAVGDISNKEISLSVKKQSRVHYTNFIEIFSSDPDQAEKVFHKGLDIVRSFENVFPGNVHLTPHAPYSVSEKLWELIEKYLQENPGMLSYHNLESKAEMELFRGERGPLAGYINLSGIKITAETNSFVTTTEHLVQAKRQLFVHNTYATSEDITYAKTKFSDYYWVFCPSSNLFIESRLPDLSVFNGEEERICLGTDSLASNSQLSIVQEIQTLMHYNSELTFDMALKWGTLNGAKALGIDSNYGSFEAGKKPGILRISGFDESKNTNVERMF